MKEIVILNKVTKTRKAFPSGVFDDEEEAIRCICLNCFKCFPKEVQKFLDDENYIPIFGMENLNIVKKKYEIEIYCDRNMLEAEKKLAEFNNQKYVSAIKKIDKLLKYGVEKNE